MLAVLLMVACSTAATPPVVEKESVGEKKMLEILREGEKIIVATPVVRVPPAGAIKMGVKDNDTITVQDSVSHQEQVENGALVRVDVYCENQNQDKTAVGSTTAIVP